MSPERILDHEKLERVHRARRLLSPKDLDCLDLDHMAHQVSAQIAVYNADHPYEMLPKTPDTIRRQFLDGNSVIIAEEDSTVLYHGTYYPNFENGEDQILDYQVVELGTAIAHPDFRNGYGLGVEGSTLRLEKAHSVWRHVIALSTNKQVLTTHVLHRAGMQAASFWDYPYLAYLTCTCENSSEACGFESCIFRRSPEESSRRALNLISKSPLGKMPCTLILSDLGAAGEFEQTCRDIDFKLGNKPLQPGKISRESMQQSASLFSRVKILASLR